MNSSDSAFRKTIRSIIPLRASVFEKSKKQLLSEIKSINKELERLREENNNLSDKLSALIMEIQENKDRSI